MLTAALAAAPASLPPFRGVLPSALHDLLAAEALYGAGLRRGVRVLLADRREQSLACHLDAIVGPTGLVQCGDDDFGVLPAAGADPRRSYDIVFDRSIAARDPQLPGRLRVLAQRLRFGGVLMLQQPPAAAHDDEGLFETGFDRLDTSDDFGDEAHADQVAGSDNPDRLAALRISRAMRCAGLSQIRWRAADSFGRHVRRLIDGPWEPPAIPVTVWAQR